MSIDKIFDLFLSQNYFLLVYISLIFIFIFILSRLFKEIKIRSNTLKLIYFIIFLPIAIIPLIKCYFNIPYVFCRACPRKCVFGEVSAFIIPSFLLLNLDKRFWCFKLCPFGTIQDYQARICKKRIKLPKIFSYSRYLILLFVIVFYFLIIYNENLKNPFFYGAYIITLFTLFISGIIFILCFFIPRFWCNHFCPVGCVSDKILETGKKFKIL